MTTTTGLTIFTRDREGTECTRRLCPTHAAPYIERYSAPGVCMSALASPDTVMYSATASANCTECRHANDVASGKVVWQHGGWDWSTAELARREAIRLCDGVEAGRGDWWS
jgi:hypothetical protein